MYNRPRRHVRKTAHDEDRRIVASVRLQNASGNALEDHAAHRAGERPDTDHRSDRGFREHVARQSIHVRRPRLMRGGRDADDYHRGPHAGGARHERSRHDQERHREHRDFARTVYRPPTLDQRARHPATANRADIRDQVHDDDRRGDLRELHSVFRVKEFWQPVEIEPPDRIGHQLSDDKRPRLSKSEKTYPWHTCADGRCVARHWRIPIERNPQQQPKQSERAGPDERPLPSPSQRDPWHDERCENRAHVRASVEDSSRQCPLSLREPLSYRLDRARENRRLANAKQRARHGESRRGPSESVADCSNAPRHDRCRQAAPHADPVDYATGGEEPESVREAEPRDDVAVVRLRPMELSLERWGQDAKHLAIDVVDSRGDEKQCTDRPPVRGWTIDIRRASFRDAHRLADSPTIPSQRPCRYIAPSARSCSPYPGCPFSSQIMRP